jgi:hypothetical protein
MTIRKSLTVETGFSTCMKWLAIFVAATTLIAGCGKKDDPIAKAEKQDVAKAYNYGCIGRMIATRSSG